MNMRLMPYDYWEMTSPLDLAALVGEMQKRIDPLDWDSDSGRREHKALRGAVQESGFNIERVRSLEYVRLPFPIAYGRFTQKKEGVAIRVRLMPHILYLLLTAAFLCVSIPAGIAGDYLISVFMGLPAILVLYCCFYDEGGMTKRLLSEMIDLINIQAADKSTLGNSSKIDP